MSSNSFGFDPKTEGPSPQNTGVSSLDHDFNEIIAKDSFERWKVINKRNLDKHKLLNQESGASGQNIQLTVDGEYVLMSDEKKEGFEKVKDNFIQPFFDAHYEEMEKKKTKED